MKTFVPKKGDIDQNWWLIDAEGKILGRLATEVAVLLRGKNKPDFSAFLDMRRFRDRDQRRKIAVTGRKAADKEYYSHSRYPGGLKTEVLADLLAKQARGSHQERRLGDDPQEQARPGRL